MTINFKIWDMPPLPVQKQVFHVPGASFDGGFTSGGARVYSPEPGGRSVLEMQFALQVSEWESPWMSWLMSKVNGEIFRIKLTKTPQIVSDASLNVPDIVANVTGVPWFDSDLPWDDDALWEDEAVIGTNVESLEGSVKLSVDVGTLGSILKHGHVIGHGDNAYMITDIEYTGTIAALTVTPPLRKNVSAGDIILLRPFFIGTISNGVEIRNSYDAGNVGHIQLSRIIFQESIV